VILSTLIGLAPLQAFQLSPSPQSSTTSALHMGYGRSSPRTNRSGERSKRQERVGHLVRSEISTILHEGHVVKKADYLEDSIRRSINVVNADVSPDLRQARITVSIISKEVVDKRRAYSWLVKSTPNIRHALAQRLSHMKSVPNLSFVQADVGAAVDVMNLIDKIQSDSYKRKSVGMFGGDDDSLPRGMHMGLDFDDDDDDGWIDDDEDEFFLDDE